MGLRDAIQNQKNVTIAIAVLAIAGATVAIAFEMKSSPVVRIKQTYYSDDDGQTYFLDDVDKLVPFDHNGKQACQAYVFKSSNGTVFVGYLARYTDQAKARLQELRSHLDGEVGQEILDTISAGTEVKRPGDANWYPQSSAQGQQIMLAKSPDGGNVVGVLP